MTATQPKRLRLPALALAALILVGCAAFGAGKYLERSQLEQLNRLLANLPEEYGFSAAEIDGSLFGRTLTLKRVSFMLLSEDGKPIDVSIGTASGEGINLTSAFVPGTATLADRLTLTDVTLNAGEGAVSAGRFTLSGVRADVPAIRNFLKDIKKYKDSGESENKAGMWNRSGFDTLGIAGVEGTDLRFSAEDNEIPSIAIGALRITEYSILSTGPVALGDIAVSLGGRRVAFIGEAGLGRLGLPAPEDFKQLKELNDSLFLKNITLKRDIRLDDLFLRQMTISPTLPDGSSGTITLDRAGMSLGYASGRSFFSMDTGALTVEKKLFALGDEALAGQHAQMRELLRYLPETIVYTSRVTTDARMDENGGATVAIKPIMARIDGFGSVELFLDMRFTHRSLEDAKIKAFEITLFDGGASEFIFSMMGKESGQDAEQMRNQSLLPLMMAGALAQSPLREMTENLGAFMEKPGATFTAKLNLPEPLDAETLGMQIMVAPDNLGLTSSVSRESSAGGKP